MGFVANEAGAPLSADLASASRIGLAVALGSQGIIQDVVSGVTIVFTDLFNVGYVVEISGQVGVVHRFGMRFTILRNPMGAELFVPDRSIVKSSPTQGDMFAALSKSPCRATQRPQNG